ncbi:MAG TPA: hypothetical protein PKA27_06660 [Fimbriimonadaceae bacterium]|nr:hypothetical protein [Fimbriimonadaceae bacterium]
MPKDREVCVRLSTEEAWELLSRCLNSLEPDTALSKDALKKLADALKEEGKSHLRLAG